LIYEKLPDLSPSYEAKDLSPPIAFVALLHMCNEKVGIPEYGYSTKLWICLIVYVGLDAGSSLSRRRIFEVSCKVKLVRLTFK